MPKAQSGVCAQASLHGLHLFFNVLDARDSAVIKKLVEVTKLQHAFDERFSEAMVSSFVAIGAQYWSDLYPDAKPTGLSSVTYTPSSAHHFASTPYDLFLQIRSDRADVNHLFAQQVLSLLAPDVELVERVSCFRFLDGRDLNGFLLHPDAPVGRAKQQIALVGDEDPAFSGGSFINVMRFTHHLAAWSKLSVHEQEQVMGRTQASNELIMPLSPDSHAVRTELKDEQGRALLLNQGMPFAGMSKQGLLQVTCANSAQAFMDVVTSQFGDANGYDLWLDYTNADLNSAYFAPSVDVLKAMAL